MCPHSLWFRGRGHTRLRKRGVGGFQFGRGTPSIPVYVGTFWAHIIRPPQKITCPYSVGYMQEHDYSSYNYKLSWHVSKAVAWKRFLYTIIILYFLFISYQVPYLCIRSADSLTPPRIKYSRPCQSPILPIKCTHQYCKIMFKSIANFSRCSQPDMVRVCFVAYTLPFRVQGPDIFGSSWKSRPSDESKCFCFRAFTCRFGFEVDSVNYHDLSNFSPILTISVWKTQNWAMTLNLLKMSNKLFEKG